MNNHPIGCETFLSCEFLGFPTEFPEISPGHRGLFQTCSASSDLSHCTKIVDCVGVSISGYLLAIRPSSAFRPFGHQPPHSMPCDSARSRAALSAPVWPPETILGKCVLIGKVYLVVESFSRIWCQDWPSQQKPVRSINRLVKLLNRMGII